MAGRKAGRKTKLTPEVQERIVQALGVGATKGLACQYAGISHECFYNWLRLGAKGRKPFSESSVRQPQVF